MLRVVYAECQKQILSVECHFAECRYAECQKQTHCAERHFAEYRYAECRGAQII